MFSGYECLYNKKEHMKLSGWQRLWILLSVIYLVIPVLFLIADWPTKKEIEDKWVYDTLEIVRQPSDSVFEIRSAYNDLSNQELVERVHKKFGKAKFEKIDKEYQKELKNLNYKRLKSFGVAFLFWIVPVIVLYILGKGVGWVYRGFRSG